MSSRHFAALGIVAIVSVLIAAAPPAQPIVTVIRGDGTTVRGKLASSNPKSLTVEPVAKPKAAPEPAVEIAWSDIKSVSNGLTQKKVIAQWKHDHSGDLCDACHGDGTTPCPTCKGTGRDAAKAKECPACHGEQTVACSTPRCDHGKIPCPRPHLKLEEGTWAAKSDGGLRWRKFPSRGGGYSEVSERHLGQVVEIKDGVPQAPTDCGLCGNKMILDDPKCHGTGKVPCPECSKRAASEKCSDCERGRVACKTCQGLGLKPSVVGLPEPPPPAATP